MNNRKWRNPYTALSKKNGQTSAAGSATPTSLSLTPKKGLPNLDLRTSVSRMRSNIKGISSTIRQMEETMDTLYGAMEMVDSLGKGSSRTAVAPAPQGKASRSLPSSDSQDADNPLEESGGGSNPLANIDMNQLLGLLQSPLVQSLLSQNNSGAPKRKKEG